MSRTYRRTSESWMAKKYIRPFLNTWTGSVDIYDWRAGRFVDFNDDEISKAIVHRNKKIFNSDNFRSNWKNKSFKNQHNMKIRTDSKIEIIKFLKDEEYEVMLPLNKKDGEDHWYWD